MNDETRRRFIAGSGKLLAVTAVTAVTGLSVTGTAQAEEHAHHGGSGEGLVVSIAAGKTCATCRFWGGMRKVSDDKGSVTAQSMGWCNNPDSPNYQNLTSADHLMKKPGIWQKWSVL